MKKGRSHPNLRPQSRNPKAERITERSNPASASLDTRPTQEILRIINREDSKVAAAVKQVIPQIARAVEMAATAIAHGGRMVYLGAGTSGRLSVLDAAECIPTFGTDRVVAVMAGAPESMFRPTEGAEDNPQQAVRDLRQIRFGRRDVLVGVSASGRTPYVLGGLRHARKLGAVTVAITSNPQSAIERDARIAIVPIVGPEVIAGSTRMKAGTAQKLVLNMLSTVTMVRLGRVLSNWMINVQLTNEKLRKRAEGIVARTAGVSSRRAAEALKKSGQNLPVALLMVLRNLSRAEASGQLAGKNTAVVLRHALAQAGRLDQPASQKLVS